MIRRGRIVERGAETIARTEGYVRNAPSLERIASGRGVVAPRLAGPDVFPELEQHRVVEAAHDLGPPGGIDEERVEVVDRPRLRPPHRVGEQRHEPVAQVADLAMGVRREEQIADRVDELTGDELGLGAVELERVERPRPVALREPEDVNAFDLVGRDEVEELRDRVAVGIEEREAPS
jgi:hypothetical protein